MSIRVLSKKEMKHNECELVAFCKSWEFGSQAYNFMRIIKSEHGHGVFEERTRILNYLKKERYLSKKKLTQFIRQPDIDEFRKLQSKVGR